MPNPIYVFTMLLISTAVQVYGVYMVPAAKGLTQPIPTLIMFAAFSLGVAINVRLVYSGVSISFLIPISSAILPLCSIAIGIIAYGEMASPARIGALVAACGLILASNYL